MSDWCIIDVFDDNINQSTKTFSTGVTTSHNVLVHKQIFSWWLQEPLLMTLEIRQ